METDIVVCDDRGRLLLPKEVREGYGRSFHVVRTAGEVVLVPASEDPVRELAELGKKARLGDFSLGAIRKALRTQAEKEL